MINNREDANKYYQQVNELIDDYIDKWKIKPSNLGRYLKNGSDRFNKFLKRNNLKEVNGIDRVLSDVIEDRINMERDAVLTFENFKFFESDEFKIIDLKSCLEKGIEKADLNMEKALADAFDTNLSSIEIIESNKHLFKVDGWNEFEIVIYSSEDLEIIKNNLVDYLVEDLKSKKVNLGGIIEFSLKDITSDVGFIRFSIGREIELKSVISKLLEMEHYKSFNGYEIWKK